MLSCEKRWADVHGIAWVMNHAASYMLVSIGLIDILGGIMAANRRASTGIVDRGWWLLRAGSQLYLGKWRRDWLILTGFALVGGLHLAVGLA